MEEKCLACNGILFRKILLDDKGHMAIDSDFAESLNFKQEDGDMYFTCPHCSSKNVVTMTRTTQAKISHIKPAGL